MTSMLGDIAIDAGDFSSKNAARLSMSLDADSARGIVKSKIVFYDCNTGGIREHANVDWKVVSMASARLDHRLFTFVLGEDGQVLQIEKENVMSRDIVRSAEPGRGPLRKVRSLGSKVVAVGMDRQVYEFDSEQVWRDISAPGTGAKPVTGFEAVAGSDQQGMYCAGWRGEIWKRFDDRWEQIDSPTNLLITDLAVGPDAMYGCGLSGLVLKGSGSRWTIMDQGAFDLNFYSIAAYDGRIFVASLYGIYELKDDKLYHLDYDIKPPQTAHTLCALPDALGVIGAKDLLLLEGKAWRRLE